jgi:phenylalanyl-tRNA synthetase alpha chain
MKQNDNWKSEIAAKLKPGDETTASKLAQAVDKDQSAVNRFVLELEEEDYLEISRHETTERFVTEKGENVIENGSPENRLLESMSKEEDIDSLRGSVNDLDIAVGKAKQRNWINIEQGRLIRNAEPEDIRDKPREMLKNGEKDSEMLINRGLVGTKKATEIQVEVKKDPSTRQEQEFNVEAEASTPRKGKKHFYYDIMSKARRKWLEMGFEEMNGDFVVSSLINFDALFTPQDHPARELHDTFFVETPSSSNLSKDEELKSSVKNVHENGGSTGSEGYGYNWKKEEAEKNVLRTHTTAVSAQKLRQLSEEDLPKKYFTISRAFRNETVDDTHLPEFYQTDGIVVGKNLSFVNLKGYLEEYFQRMGFEKIRIIPTYYPYTEMSAEVQVYDRESDEWMGLGGSGIFRQEVVKPLLGFEANVLAWGLGIGRIAMKSAEITDIRNLYDNKINRIMDTPYWYQ